MKIAAKIAVILLVSAVNGTALGYFLGPVGIVLSVPAGIGIGAVGGFWLASDL